MPLLNPRPLPLPERFTVRRADPGSFLPRDRIGAAVSRLLSAGASVAGRLRSARSHRAVRLVTPPLALLVLLAAGPVHHVYFDRSGLPDLESFLRFEPPRIGEIYDARGKVLIELAR